MKRTFSLFVVICLCLVTFGQKKYEMVIEKTDATSVIIKTEDILRTYFRAIEESNQDEDVIDQNIFGIWDLIKEEGFEDGYNYSKDYKSRGALRYLEFCEDMTYTIYSKSRDEGPSQPGKWNTPKSGTFSMNADKKELTLVGDYKGKFEIIELTNSTLMIKETWGDGFYEIGTYKKVDKSVLPSDNNGSQSDLGLVGTWCYGSSEENALGDRNSIEGYVFRTDGTCTYFAIYNKGINKEKRNGTYTYNNNELTIIMTSSYEWKNNKWEQEGSYSSKTHRYIISISGNRMDMTGDDNETLWTREGFTVDLGEETNDNQGENSNEEEDYSDPSDPEGTVITECRHNKYLYLFEEDKYGIYCDKNLFGINNAYIKVVDCGEVNGLADINYIPTSGWVQETYQIVGHGYVFRWLNASTNTFVYARLYIVAQKGKMDYIIKYQVPFVL